MAKLLHGGGLGPMISGIRPQDLAETVEQTVMRVLKTALGRPGTGLLHPARFGGHFLFDTLPRVC
ncbi:hypothetical protein QIH19_28815, partial [Klebsiella pneumoniae]|nr:hypothetical protein [Klebsiella pneumoniae]